MTNKYRRLGPTPIPQIANEEMPIGDLTLGAYPSLPPRVIPPGGSPNLDLIRFENGALRKDFGTTAVGTAAATRVLAIGEHKYILNQESYHRLVRLHLEGGQLRLDVWDGSSWVATALSNETVQEVYLSIASIQDRFLMADGSIILQWYESAATAEHEDDFTAANSLDAVGETVDAVVAPAGAVGNDYAVYFSVDLTITNGTDYTVTVALLHEGVQIATKELTLANGSNSWLDQVFNTTRSISSGDTLTLKLLNVEASSPPTYHETWGLGDPDLQASKTIAESPEDGFYTYRYKVTHGGDDFTVEFYYREVSTDPWTAIGTLIHDASDNGVNVEVVKEIGDLPLNAQFAVDVIQGDWEPGAATGGVGVPDSGNGVSYDAVVAGTDYTIDVHGYNKVTDADPFAGVVYDTEVPPTSYLIPLSADAPDARFILPFGDRLLAYRDGGDTQVASWSTDGDITDWVDGDSGSTVLLDTRSDGIDDIMGCAVLSSSIVAVFRKRSIMRAQETGNIQLAMAHYHWIENLGTESSFSIQSTPWGIIFLGHDLQVYLLTESGPRAIGQPIHTEMVKRLTSNLDLVDSEYDPVFSEYILGIPEDNASNITGLWIFDMARFVEEQKLVWRYRTQNVERLAVVSLVE